MRTIGIALFEDAEELDVVGPWEVLSSWARGFPEDGVEMRAVGRTREPIRCAKGLRMIPDVDWAGAPALDVLVYPGGIGTRRDLADPAVLDWLRDPDPDSDPDPDPGAGPRPAARTPCPASRTDRLEDRARLTRLRRIVCGLLLAYCEVLAWRLLR